NPATTTASAAAATWTRRASLTASLRERASPAATTQPAKPIEGKYRNLSAMMLPMISSKLDVGSNATKKKAPKKHVGGGVWRKDEINATKAITPANAANPAPQETKGT